MPLGELINNDLFNTIAKIRKMNGAIFYDRVPGGTSNATATGTGTSRTSISTTYTIPSAAKEILAISPGLASTADAAANSKFAFVDIQGVAFKKQPQQILAPIGSITLSVGATRFTPQEWWTVRAPVISGDQYDWGVTPLVSNANNMSAWVDIMYSTIVSGDPVVYSQVQTTVNAFKSAGSNTGGTLSLTAATELYEVATGVSPETAAVAGETQILSHQLQCSALDPVQTFIYGSEGPAQITATSGDTQMGQIARWPAFGLKFKIPNPIINYSSILKTATTNNLTTAHCARYISF